MKTFSYARVIKAVFLAIGAVSFLFYLGTWIFLNDVFVVTLSLVRLLSSFVAAFAGLFLLFAYGRKRRVLVAVYLLPVCLEMIFWSYILLVTLYFTWQVE